MTDFRTLLYTSTSEIRTFHIPNAWRRYPLISGGAPSPVFVMVFGVNDLQVQSAMEWQTETFTTERKLTGLLHAASLGRSEQPLGNKSSSINTWLVFNSTYLVIGKVNEFVSNSMKRFWDLQMTGQ